jgi:predicted O-methyltransferase YrrM
MLPWLTKEAIIFLDRFLQLHPQSRMLEFGSGNSTEWFARRVHNLISIDHDAQWHKAIQDRCTQFKNVELRLVPNDYAHVCAEFPDNYFDIILVDGKDRVRCAQQSLRLLKPGGILVLDDAERTRYAPIFELLKDWPCTITEQNKPSKAGALELGKTVWWIKPQL